MDGDFRQTSIDSPRLVAAAGAALVGLGILQLGNIVVAIVLIPAATLGVMLVVLWLIRWLARIGAVNYFWRLLATAKAELRQGASSSPQPKQDGSSDGKE